MIALIDTDIVAFRCSIVHEEGTLDNAKFEANDMILRILDATGATSYKCYLTGRGNTRKEIDPAYKANRKDKPLPKWLNDVKNHITEEWSGITSVGIEADDLLGIEQSTCQSAGIDSCIASIDKDLLQVPGKHYNFVKDEWTTVSPLDGLHCFYRQLLTGDRADNILVPFRIGPVKSSALIDGLTEEHEMLDVVRRAYGDDEWLERHGKLLWIHQRDNDWWKIPEFDLTYDEELDYPTENV